MNFQYHLPVNLIFGRSRITELGKIASEYGKRAMVVTGTGSTKRSGLLNKCLYFLETSGLNTVVYDQVPQNPLTTTALMGADLVKEHGCDVIIGIGGGSVMDCAKAIAFLAVNEGDVNDYIFGRKISECALPLVLVPTTCGTGSEGNSFAVLTNPDNGDKKSLRTNGIIAKASIIDSELMESMPPGILVSVGFDALCHLMEAYISRAAQPMTEMMCLSGIRLIGKHLTRLYDGDGTEDDWDALAWASTLGGMVINTAGVTLPHAMEHPASGLRNIVHGKGLAALTPVIMEASVDGARQKFADISRLLGGSRAEDCPERIRMLLGQLGLDIGLGELGITTDDIPWMAKNCLKVSGVSVANHPVLFSEEEIGEYYKKALVF